ncbi:MAG: efflux RND transporter periplasmic adaptor subunit, partial [Gammaproteobacteria bacterium]|nr:efflux RND transporter periplasmic adaptor subunit [Gammaproteobacteria bacterium]
RIGQIANFRVGGFGDRRFEGRVERINPMTDTGSRSVMLYLSVDNPDGVLKGGMFAQGELILNETAPVPAIPLSAVHIQAGLPYVFVIDGAKIARRPVKLGLRSEEQNLVEVREGLETGVHVVSARIDTLKEGSPVVVTAAAADVATSGSR